MADLAAANISILSMVGNAPAGGALRQRNIDSGCNFSELLSSQQPKAQVSAPKERLHDNFEPRTQTSQNSDRPDYTAEQKNAGNEDDGENVVIVENTIQAQDPINLESSETLVIALEIPEELLVLKSAEEAEVDTTTDAAPVVALVVQPMTQSIEPQETIIETGNIDQIINITKPEKQDASDNSQEEFSNSELTTIIRSNDDDAHGEETAQPELVATAIPVANILVAPESYSGITNIDTESSIQALVSPIEADAQPQSNLGEDLDGDSALQKPPVETRTQDRPTQERIVAPTIVSESPIKAVAQSNNLELAQEKLASHNPAQAPSQNKISAELTNIVKSVEVTNAHEIAPISNSSPDQGKNFEQNLSGENDAYKLPDGLTENIEIAFEGIEDNIQLKTTSTSAASITNKSENLQSKNSSNILSQISDSIADAALDTKYLNDKRVVTIILQPESLGSIEARVERGITGQLKVTLTVENKETFDIINSTKIELMDAVTKITGAEDATFRFDLKEGSHGNGGYEENQNRFAFNEESQNRDADNRPILAINPLPYNNLPHYNEGVSLLI